MQRAGGLSRREFLTRAGVAGAALTMGPAWLAACTSDTNQLSFQNWTDYIDPSILRDFQSQTGISASYQTYVSNDELATRLLLAASARRRGRTSTTFDLIVPSENFVRQFLEQDLLQQIDAGTLSNIGNLQPQFRNEGFDPGNTYTIPWATGTTGIGYDTSVFDTPPDWSVFLDTTYHGKMTILDEIRDAYGAALFSLGKDPNTTSQTDIDAATDQLIAMKAVIRGFDSSTYIGGLAGGDLVVAHAYSGDLLQAKRSNPKLDFVLPEAGALRWVDSLAVPVDAPDVDNARTFMDYYLQADVSAKNANSIQYDTANQAAVELLDTSVKGNPVIFPPADLLDRLSFTVNLGADGEKLYAEGWKRVQDA